MARIEKTVFVSYRRVDRWPALAVFKDLTQHGYDVFIDYDGIASGDFERAIVDNIRARAHFVLLLTPTALERCDDPADWLRREIEVALEAKRNIVPLPLRQTSCRPHFHADDPRWSDKTCKEIDGLQSSKNKY
jgi:TIR domain